MWPRLTLWALRLTLRAAAAIVTKMSTLLTATVTFTVTWRPKWASFGATLTSSTERKWFSTGTQLTNQAQWSTHLRSVTFVWRSRRKLKWARAKELFTTQYKSMYTPTEHASSTSQALRNSRSALKYSWRPKDSKISSTSIIQWKSSAMAHIVKYCLWNTGPRMKNSQWNW